MTAAEGIEVRIEPIGRGPRRLLVLAGAAVAAVLSHELVATSRVVLVRRATGEVLASGTPEPSVRIELLDRMREALATMPEEAFVERWCDPSTWEALART